MTISPSPIDQTGDHRVYARWPAPSGNATNATYTVTYEGGTASVVVNQRVNGGQWVLLGTFPFAASGGGYKVELADNALGTVAADAIHVVRETVASDSFTWTPAIPASGTYDLYARWTAASGNSAAASYTVVHGTGTDVVTVSQKQNGGQWHHLGTYEFEPDAGHQVTLTAAADGAVVADAIRLVGTGPAPADIAYIHADQLGTPQKLTDAAQAIVWDRVQDPFGRQVSLTAGTGVANPLRFPGQLFDAETGFHYNYFRDYDPSTGRYIQSDPIGLGGGINTFAYVGGSPIAVIDQFGLNGRKLDPSSQECQDLARKINNIESNIAKREAAASSNPNNLPFDPPYPGAPARASVSGHIGLINDAKSNLHRRQQEYNDKCGGPPTGSAPVGVPLSTTQPSDDPGNNMTPVAIGVTVCGVALFCVLVPEICLPALALGGGATVLSQ